MTRHSDSLILVWKIAEAEARNLGSVEIEPVHLFLGLLKIVDISAGFVAEYFQKGRQESIEASTYDIFVLRATFADAGLESTPLRQELRLRLRNSSEKSSGRLRRSNEARMVFREAESAALLIVRPINLLSALLTARIPALEAFLSEVGLNYPDLVTVVQTSARTNGGGKDAPNLLGRKGKLSGVESELRRMRN
jgi:hypothetical protein